jgi:Flp pilus assembly protein TadD
MAVADTVNVELLVSGSIPNIARWNGPVGDSLLAALHSDTDQTLTRLRAAVAATPPDGLPRVGLQAIRQAGGKLLIEGHLADATRLYETAAELMPKVPQAKLLLGDAYVRAGRFADARAQFQAAHQADTLNTEANEWLRALPR